MEFGLELLFEFEIFIVIVAQLKLYSFGIELDFVFIVIKLAWFGSEFKLAGLQFAGAKFLLNPVDLLLLTELSIDTVVKGCFL